MHHIVIYRAEFTYVVELKLGTSKPLDNVSFFSGSLFAQRQNVRLRNTIGRDTNVQKIS